MNLLPLEAYPKEHKIETHLLCLIGNLNTKGNAPWAKAVVKVPVFSQMNLAVHFI